MIYTSDISLTACYSMPNSPYQLASMNKQEITTPLTSPISIFTARSASFVENFEAY
jgi:hypothetical protein